jgi:hypothetical protein
MNRSGRIRRGSGGGVGLYPPVYLRAVANQLDPRNPDQNCDSGADGKSPPEMACAVHDDPSDRADDNACDIAQTVLHASPFARRRRSGQRQCERKNVFHVEYQTAVDFADFGPN